MADNTTLNAGTGGDVISTDDIAGVKVQRVKVQYGADGSATDVATATPLPVDPTIQTSTTGTITANGQTVVLTGLKGGTGYVYLNGTVSGLTIAFEVSPEGTNWYTASGMRANQTAGAPITTHTLTSGNFELFEVDLRGASQLRVRATAFTSGTGNVTLVATGQVIPAAGQTLITLVAPTTNTPDPTTARTSSSTGTTVSNAGGNTTAIMCHVLVTAVSGTTPTLTVRLQYSPDGGTTWVDWDTTNLQTTSITATGTYLLQFGPGLPTTANQSLNAPIPTTWRFAWTIGGTSPSFTFSCRYSPTK